MRRILIAITALLAAATLYARSWEPTELPTDRQAPAERVEADQPEVWVRGTDVFITTQHPVTVKVFSILGQLISQETVPAGTYKLHMAARGIYILKAGTLTRRITI